MEKAPPLLTAGAITVKACVASTGVGSVGVTWGALSGRLTPDEARAFALSIILAAESVETDEFLMKFAQRLAPADARQPAEWLLGEVHKLRARGQRDETHG